MPPLRGRRRAVRAEESGAVEGCAAAGGDLELVQVSAVQPGAQSARVAETGVVGEAHIDRLILELTQVDQRIDRVALRARPERSARVAMDARLALRGIRLTPDAVRVATRDAVGLDQVRAIGSDDVRDLDVGVIDRG